MAKIHQEVIDYIEDRNSLIVLSTIEANGSLFSGGRIKGNLFRVEGILGR